MKRMMGLVGDLLMYLSKTADLYEKYMYVNP